MKIMVKKEIACAVASITCENPLDPYRLIKNFTLVLQSVGADDVESVVSARDLVGFSASCHVPRSLQFAHIEADI